MRPNEKRIEALFRAINRTSADAITREELTEELRSSGVDPDQFVNRVRSRLRSVKSASPIGSTRRVSLPLISQLRRLTSLSPNDIARSLGVPLAFLSAIERHLDVTPTSWNEELASRIEHAFQIGKDLTMAIFERQSRLELANLNRSSSDQKLRPEDILEMSGMDERSKQFWLDLARTR